MAAAVLGTLCFSFFFLPPDYSFAIADPQDWLVLIAFLLTAIIVGWLSAQVSRRAAEAEAGRKEVCKLNEELEHRVIEWTSQLTAANEGLAESEERFRKLVEALPDAMTPSPAGGSASMEGGGRGVQRPGGRRKGEAAVPGPGNPRHQHAGTQWSGCHAANSEDYASAHPNHAQRPRTNRQSS
jgi:uncharacterized protein DUF4118